MSINLEKSIFLEALELDDPSQRLEFLDRSCGSNEGLRKSVDHLLAAHANPCNLLDKSSNDLDNVRGKLLGAAMAFEPEESATDDRLGETIGPYKLMEKLGEGGFGEVYVAVQQKPIRRRVALKLIKAGMNSREVVARFEAERQALAMMDHPNIARVLDGGSTANGQPFFVMELVRGVPITEFCDAHKLATNERLRLFVDVCLAVHHAHQKGVIHRDIKPTNTLVTLHDTKPVAKVIDFGVAKAIGVPFSNKTIYTRFTQMIGTPMYMSPEQAEMSGLDVDTRADIYALGVMMYELITGSPPFDQRRISTATFDELRKIIREEEPPRPSLRLSSRNTEVDSVASRQGTSPRQLIAALQGDIDWIVMKAIEKDRTRRYDTPADFAKDVERYLQGQPIVARPPSHWYRFRKYAERNRTLLITVGLVALALVAGTAVSTWQAVRATIAQTEANQLRNEAEEFADRLKEANVLLDSARSNAEESRWQQAYTQYSKAIELQPDHFLAWAGRGSLFLRLSAWDSAAADFSQAIELGAPGNNPGWWGIPQLCLLAGNQEKYDLLCSRISTQLENSEDPAFAMMAARGILAQERSTTQANTLLRRAIDELEKRDSPERRPPGTPRIPRFPPFAGDRPGPPGPPPPGGPDSGMIRRNLHLYLAGLAAFRATQYDQAIKLLNQRTEDEKIVTVGPSHFAILAMANHKLGNKEEANKALDQAQLDVDQWAKEISDDVAARASIPWFDYVEAVVLLREAHLKIRGEPLAMDAVLKGHESQAKAMLSISQ